MGKPGNEITGYDYICNHVVRLVCDITQFNDFKQLNDADVAGYTLQNYPNKLANEMNDIDTFNMLKSGDYSFHNYVAKINRRDVTVLKDYIDNVCGN